MDSDTMTAASAALVTVGFRVVRFEFAYMAARRTSGGRKPPPRADGLQAEYLDVVEIVRDASPLFIGGKSLGGRVASMVADQLYAENQIAGLFCLGFPFHPPKKPENLRTAHLLDLRTPTLICQGTRDPFGNREEVEGYTLSSQIELFWLQDGDHDLKPRKKVSGHSASQHLQTMAVHAMQWARRVCD